MNTESFRNKKINIGIDVGSVSVKLAILDGAGRVLSDRYVRHRGHPLETARRLLDEAVENAGLENVLRLAVTGSGGRILSGLVGAEFVNEVIAQAKATARLQPGVRSIIEIGGQDSKLILLRKGGVGETSIEDFSMNTICAAGTGSFLDQQASRLGVAIEEDFGAMALRSKTPPRIAGRCSVFAKSDMIHLQQQAAPDYDIVAGLCYAMARNFKSNLGKGKEIRLPVAFQGGVAANRGVVDAFRNVLKLGGGDLVIPARFATMGAVGAALVAMEGAPPGGFGGLDALRAPGAAAEKREKRMEPLSFRPGAEKRHYIGFPEASLPEGDSVDAYLGIDVGSISTNVAALDAEGRILAKSYLMTAGRPLEAVRKGLEEVGRKVGDRIEVRGVCTTGSGRYLTGDFVGADVVRNEITSQATAAAAIDPEVDTIFEIGGQDSKFVSLHRGVVVDFEMNHACAAGTGSFLEEQSERLGIRIEEEFGRLALECPSPVKLGERCTVFMETDLLHHQHTGARTDELVAGLSYSIVHNYLNRVVGNRRIGERIFFQGGVAANRGVVAAFEKVTGKDIIVPMHHEVTGAIGAALLAKDFVASRGPVYTTSFRGFELSRRRYALRSFVCGHCPNECEIKEVTIEGAKPLYYGSRCDRYNLRETGLKGRALPDLFRERRRLLLRPPSRRPSEGAVKIGLPRALFFHESLPFWRTFLSELGFEVVLSDPTNREITHKGTESVLSETCFPVKVAHGHVLNLLDKGVKNLFFPSVVSNVKDDPGLEWNFYCPYVQTIPYLLEAAVDFKAYGARLLRPVIFFDRGRKPLVKVLHELFRHYGKSRSEVEGALEAASHAQKAFREGCLRAGREALDRLPEGTRAAVIVSRPYNGCDPGMNLDIPKKLLSMGVLPIPMDFLPLESVAIPGEWRDMFWKYGRNILKCGRMVRKDPRLNAIYITNFSCGPDSFITTFFKRTMGSEPFLTLEIDEHSADAGVLTRCEAFLDSLAHGVARSDRRPAPLGRLERNGDGRTLYIPYMADHVIPFAAAFRACGIDVEVLPPSDEESLAWGRRYTTGKECFPATVTMGDMLRKIHQPGFRPDRAAFFMPSGSGPCRFGQYRNLHRLVLSELGYGEIPLISPNQGQSFYEDLKGLKRDPSRKMWHALVGTDVLVKALHHTRPYELRPGETLRVYRRCLDRLADAILSGDVFRAMRENAAAFRAIPVDRSERKPIVGIVGEIFVRWHSFSNDGLVEKLESLGLEVWLASFAEWIYYINFTRHRQTLRRRQFQTFATNFMKDRIQQSDERRLARPFRGLVENLDEADVRTVLGYCSRYIDDSFEGEAVLSVGKAVDYHREKLRGIVNVMPFTCMPGNIVTGVLKRLREDNDDIPCISIAYDGQAQAGILTRLEAFSHQARQFRGAR